MALSVVSGGHGSGGVGGNEPTGGSPNPNPNGFLAKSTMINHSTPSVGKQTFGRASKVKTTPGKLGQSSKLAQSVSSLRRKGALA